MMQREQLDSILQSQYRLLESISQVLQAELEAMLAGNTTELPALAARKLAICGELEQLELARVRCADEAGSGLLHNPPAPMALDHAARSRKIRELAQAVTAANQRNGLVVSALIRNTRGALDILRGIPAAEAAGVYGPYGQALGGHQASKTLASA